jgi:hypothetical protein
MQSPAQIPFVRVLAAIFCVYGFCNGSIMLIAPEWWLTLPIWAQGNFFIPKKSRSELSPVKIRFTGIVTLIATFIVGYIFFWPH